MDGKTSFLAGLLVAILISGGFFTILINTEENVDSENDNSDEINTDTQVNLAPKIMIGNYTKNWDGENVTLNGFVTDESAVTSKVSVEIFHINLLMLFEVSDISVSSEGGRSPIFRTWQMVCQIISYR